jgi:hypothetical protein
MYLLCTVQPLAAMCTFRTFTLNYKVSLDIDNIERGGSTYAHMFVYRYGLNVPDIDTELHGVTSVKTNFTMNGTTRNH